MSSTNTAVTPQPSAVNDAVGLAAHGGRVARAEYECDVVVANTPELLTECFRLRYQVYCIEKSFEPENGDQETDDFDARARHVLLVHRESGEPIGTVRVIPPASSAGPDSFPMTRVRSPGLLRNLPVRTTGEISRLAVSKQRRLSCRAGTMVRLGLMQGILRLSSELGLTHWCAVMEPVLLRLLQMNAIYFAPLGSLVEHHGYRQPAYAHSGTVLERIRSESRDVWDYITMDGTLWYENVPDWLVA